jgi:pyruvate/2-oxoglutarate dehydrogenase complex dihydrolipoamide dehydrogenase (E3) component
LKLIADRRGYVLGASILGAHAGELALLWVLAIERRLRLRALAQTFAPYPTWGEIDKAAAWYFLKLQLGRPLIRAAVRALSWLP